MSTEERDDARVYELGYVLVPTIAEEKLGGEVTALKDVLDRAKAIVISEEFPKMITLSYTMRKALGGRYHKFTSGYFGWVKFEADGDKVSAVQKEYEKNDSILRFLLIKTVRENTLAPKNLVSKGDRTVMPKKEVKKEEGVPVSEVELEKSIEKMIAE